MSDVAFFSKWQELRPTCDLEIAPLSSQTEGINACGYFFLDWTLLFSYIYSLFEEKLYQLMRQAVKEEAAAHKVENHWQQSAELAGGEERRRKIKTFSGRKIELSAFPSRPLPPNGKEEEGKPGREKKKNKLLLFSPLLLLSPPSRSLLAGGS